MKLRPLGDRIWVKPIPEEAVTKGGVHLPSQAQEKPRRGEVLAVGPGLPRYDDSGGVGERMPVDVQVGDVVLFSQYGGVDLRLDGESYLVLREGDLLGVMEDGGVPH